MNLGMPETIFIVLLALIVFGPKRLPELAAKAGKIMADLKRASNDFTRQLTTEIEQVNIEEERKKFKERAEELWKDTTSGFSINPPAEGGVARSLTDAGVSESEIKTLESSDPATPPISTPAISAAPEVGDNGLPPEGAFVPHSAPPPVQPVLVAQEASSTTASEANTANASTVPPASAPITSEAEEKLQRGELRRMASSALDELRRMAQSQNLTSPSQGSSEPLRSGSNGSRDAEVVKESSSNV